ncbi:hypothetical protein PsYK624_091430 [Phanerochaete sordida]|uniref:F-box domain-containing protein n=1 Tax=Phanerochaete sordida TaxID=48140 RepID=A0A9P3GEQ5_9APHY|nr:hypothetical protein PsYK624_091430 [Phanerochaete sordida]
MIIDHVAYTDDFDEFPTIPLTDLASCSLTCRGWLDRSSHHLFRRLRFQASSTEPSMEEGEKAYERLETLMLAATQSRRLTTYITGASIWWSVGMPPTVIMVDTIVLAFPNLAYLRFQNSPSPDLSISELRTRKHYSVKCFDLWMRRGQYTSQNWIFEYLRLFQRVDHLRIVAASRLDETEYLPRSSHLHVKHLELCESAFDILRALKRTLALSSLTSLTIDWPSSWDPEIVSIYTLDQFLETCSATLTHFSLSCETQRRPHWKSPKPTRLENLSKCNKLVSVKLNIIEAWEFEEIYDDLLRWMPTSIRRICFTADSPIPPSERRRGPDLIYWPALAEWVASRPALERVDVLVDVISQHFADDDPTTEALRADPPRCAAMERRMIERDFGWVEAQYKSMRNYMSRNDRRKVNVLLNLMLRRKLCRDEGRRVVTLQLDTRQGKVLRFGP